MSEKESLVDRLPYLLRMPVENLIEEFGKVDNILVGLLVNLSLAATGVAIVLLFDGVIAYLGAAWAIINLIGIVSWVFGL